MPIRRLLNNNAFGPDEITVMIGAFEDTLRALKLIDRNDPMTLLVAKKIIELAQAGRAESCSIARGSDQIGVEVKITRLEWGLMSYPGTFPIYGVW